MDRKVSIVGVSRQNGYTPYSHVGFDVSVLKRAFTCCCTICVILVKMEVIMGLRPS